MLARENCAAVFVFCHQRLRDCEGETTAAREGERAATRSE